MWRNDFDKPTNIEHSKKSAGADYIPLPAAEKHETADNRQQYDSFSHPGINMDYTRSSRLLDTEGVCIKVGYEF
jgi:hypothetical protein